MDGPGRFLQALRPHQRRERGRHRFGPDVRTLAAQFRQRSQHVFEAFGAADPAAGAAGQRAAAALEPGEALRCNLDRDADAARRRLHFDAVDIARAIHDAFAHGEAEREILQVGGRGEHHGVRNAVVLERDRHLVGQHRGAQFDLAVAIVGLDRRLGGRGQPRRLGRGRLLTGIRAAGGGDHVSRQFRLLRAARTGPQRHRILVQNMQSCTYLCSVGRGSKTAKPRNRGGGYARRGCGINKQVLSYVAHLDSSGMGGRAGRGKPTSAAGTAAAADRDPEFGKHR